MSTALANAEAKEAGTIPAPPFSSEAEQALLAAVLSDARTFPEALELVTSEMFGDPKHAAIWAALADLDSKGQKATGAALAGTFPEPGDRRYLLALAAVGLPYQTESYARAVRDIWQRRRIHRAALEAAYSAAYPDRPNAGAEIAEALDAQLFEIGSNQSADLQPVSLADAGGAMLRLYEEAHRNGGTLGTPTGYRVVDNMLGGLEGSNLYILGARPSMGKTALAVGVMERMSRAGSRVLFFQLEMNAPQIARRMAASLSGIDVSEIKRARLDGAPWRRLVEVQAELAALPVLLIDKPGITAAQIRSTARREKRRAGLDLIIVDHLTLMGAPPEWERQGMVYKVGQNSGALKRLAKELDVPILVLCQLSRASENREERRPQLSDLRWSGEIEQDADVVLFLHREEYYLERAKPTRKPNESGDEFAERLGRWEGALEASRGRAEIIVAKQRDGAVGIVELGFEGATTRFRDLDEPHRFDTPQTSLELEGGR